MATLNEAIASECSYALPRKDASGQTKVIEGPSIRFAEIIGSAWRNAHVATRIVDDDGEFVTAQAVFHDLERNWKVMEEVSRRVTDKRGRRYSADMVGVTANAARSIAMRNAVLHGIPKAFWQDIWSAARRTAVGDQHSLETKRLEAIKAFAPFGIKQEDILRVLDRKGLEDMTIEDLQTLFGFLTAIKDGEATPESIFAPEPQPTTSATADVKEKLRGKTNGETKAQPTPPPVAQNVGNPGGPLRDDDPRGKPLTYPEARKLLDDATAQTIDDAERAIERFGGMDDLRMELSEYAQTRRKELGVGKGLL